MNKLDEPHSALYGVLVEQPSAQSTAFAHANASAVPVGKVAATVLGIALLSCLWWVAA